MKIAVFYPDSRHAAWSSSHGLVRALQRMGHVVTPGAIQTDVTEISSVQFQDIKNSQPALDLLRGQDLILISAPELVAPWLEAIYGKEEWNKLTAPKAAWYQESFFREDFKIDFEAMAPWADQHFFPAAQDAEFFDQESFAKDRAHWLPLGVDTRTFYKSELEFPKTWPIAFIGTMHEKRQHFLKALSRHDFPRIRIGRVSVEDLGGWQAEVAADRLASNYWQVGVFFNLPSMSQLLTSKVYEAMACGTFVLTPLLSDDRGISRNQEVFQSGHHLVYYKSSNLPYVAQLLREWSSEEKAAEREKIAATGCQEVHVKHSLERRLEVILGKCGIKETMQ